MRNQLGRAALLGALLAAACADPARQLPTAPFQAVGQSGTSYIVVLQPHADPRAVAASAGASPRFVYRNALNGFSAPMSEAAVEALRRNPLVQRIELDGIATINQVPWGLDRIDQRALPLDNSYNPPNAGSNVHVYILDTGIVPELGDFGGRASIAADFAGGDGRDCHGHGTHVAGTVGGAVYGVAKAAQLRAVKVFPSCSASTATSTIIAGLDWVALNHSGPSVANLSVGGPFSDAFNDAVAGLTASGVAVVVAAGNNQADACSYSPSSAPSAITVGATDAADNRAAFSNYGACVDLFAPGVNIVSLGLSGAATTMSGTSMSSPHVAGVAALVLSASPFLTPAQVDSVIRARATKGVVQNAASVNFHLLFSGTTDDNSTPVPPPPPPAPAAPSNVTVSITQQDTEGAVLAIRWQDNSTNETRFEYRASSHFGDVKSGSTAFPPPAYLWVSPAKWVIEVRAANTGGSSAWVAAPELCLSGWNYTCEGTPPDTTTPPPPPPPPPPPDDAPPVAAFSWNCPPGKKGLCSFDASGSSDDQGITGYSWNFGDGTTGSGLTTSHQYTVASTFTVTLTVLDTAGQTATTSRSVSVRRVR